MLSTIIKKKRALNCIWNFNHKKSHKQTISVTYDLKKLKDYIDFCYLNEQNTEMRIYFGHYRKENNSNLLDPDYDDRHMLIFVPVKNGEDNVPDDLEKIFSSAFDEGDLCPPKKGCKNTTSLFSITENSNVFDPTVPDDK